MTAYYFAPMEGIGGYVFRSAYHRHFQGFDKYFTPFIAPNKKHYLSNKALKDISIDNNLGMKVVPQILTNDSRSFIETARRLQEHGYSEVNLNLGCPSPTVVTKGKGSGMLKDLDALKAFLDDIYSLQGLDISIKTRIGLSDIEHFENLMVLFNAYPLAELIIHPRLQRDFYQNTPDLNAFKTGCRLSTASVCYNGDLFNLDAINRFKAAFPNVNRLMLGRGILMNPGLLSQVKGNEAMTLEDFSAFHKTIFDGYSSVLFGDQHVLDKMKELWGFWSTCFEACEKPLKRIKKSERCSDYLVAVEMMYEKKLLTV